MRCDLHVHTLHSGMCGFPAIGGICRESYNRPEEAYETLKRRGMDLVTITDHDSISAVEALRSRPDFFLSEEVTCRMPSGTEMHAGVYDITERQHAEIQRRRCDLPSLAAYLQEQRLFFSANHIFSGLTGARAGCDFDWFEATFPAFEILNGHMLPNGNRHAARLAQEAGKAVVAGSDAHTLPSLASAYTEVPNARSKEEFLAGLRAGSARARGESGGYWKLTREILLVALGMAKENWLLAPLLAAAPAIPAVMLVNFLLETAFAHRWGQRVSGRRGTPGAAALAAGRVSEEALL